MLVTWKTLVTVHPKKTILGFRQPGFFVFFAGCFVCCFGFFMGGVGGCCLFVFDTVTVF